MTTQSTEGPSTKVLILSAVKYARSLTHDIQDAEDLAHQAWFNLTKKYKKVETKALLYTAIRHLYYDKLRRNRVIQYSSLEDLPEPTLVESYGVNHDMNVALKELSETRTYLHRPKCRLWLHRQRNRNPTRNPTRHSPQSYFTRS